MRPTAAFTVNSTTGTTASTISFADQSPNSPNAWQWKFSPNTVTYLAGTSALSQNPQVSFTANGVYSVKLVVSNSAGADSLNKASYITISNVVVKPTAAFTQSAAGGMAGTSINYTDQSTNIPTSWIWTVTPNYVTYLGGTNAASQNPQIQFDSIGIYSVKLRASNSAGADSITKASSVTITRRDTTPVAAFAASSIVGTTDSVFTFTDLSTHRVASWLWTISPSTFSYQAGTGATSQNPVVKFSKAGKYTVTLAATNPAGTGSAIKTDYITIRLGLGIEQQGIETFAAYPIPMQDQLKVAFDMPRSEEVLISLLLLDGTVAQVLHDGELPGGAYHASFDLGEFASGTYILQIKTPTTQIIRRVIKL